MGGDAIKSGIQSHPLPNWLGRTKTIQLQKQKKAKQRCETKVNKLSVQTLKGEEVGKETLHRLIFFFWISYPFSSDASFFSVLHIPQLYAFILLKRQKQNPP